MYHVASNEQMRMRLLSRFYKGPTVMLVLEALTSCRLCVRRHRKGLSDKLRLSLSFMSPFCICQVKGKLLGEEWLYVKFPAGSARALLDFLVNSDAHCFLHRRACRFITFSFLKLCNLCWCSNSVKTSTTTNPTRLVRHK